MKKTIKDLKLGDSVWRSQGTTRALEYEIVGISTKQLTFKTERSEGYARLEDGDLTRWFFVDHHGYEYYLSLLDSLNAQRKCLDKHMEHVFQRQHDFLASIKETNNMIRNCENEINTIIKN